MLISQLAAASGETPSTLRFYETAGLLTPPPRTPGGYRDYPTTAIAQVCLVRVLQTAGLDLDHVAALIELHDTTRALTGDAAALLDDALAHIDGRLEALGAARDQLAALACHHQPRPGDPPHPSRRTRPNHR